MHDAVAGIAVLLKIEAEEFVVTGKSLLLRHIRLDKEISTNALLKSVSIGVTNGTKRANLNINEDGATLSPIRFQEE